MVKVDHSVQSGGASSSSWYIWYTKPRAEKKIFQRLADRQVEVFLPLRKELRQWSDRKKWVEVPLFSGYIFTRISEKELEKIKYTEGILTYVRSEGRPATLSESEVGSIRLLIDESPQLEVAENTLSPGEPVEVIFGPLRGLHGELINYRGNNKMAVRIEQLGKVMLVQLPKGYVRSRQRA